ncbi:MAG: DivIVA domain-containing protein [Eubacteriales bacterium]
MDMTEKNMELEFEQEYKNAAVKIIQNINEVKFTQLFKGYSTGEVDALLDSIINEIKLATNPGYIRQTANLNITTTFRGYSKEEVDAFLAELEPQLETLNNINKKIREF